MKIYQSPILALIGIVLLLSVMACGGDDSDSPSTTGPQQEELVLKVNTPMDGAMVDASRIIVSGTTLSDAVVSINGTIVDVDFQGGFSSEINLEVGPNLIDVVASDFYGDEKSVALTVFYVAALPLTITHPMDEAVVKSSSVVVKGTTNADAILSVNGQMVEVDALGNFSVLVELEEGPNLIEVIASDFDGNSSAMTVTAIRIP